MPQRQNTIIQPTPELQGEDSWVRYTRPTMGTIRRIIGVKGIETDAELSMEAARALIIECVREWNWVDDGGESLPFPGDHPDVLDTLTDAEFTYLVNLLTPSLNTPEAKKKTTT